VLSSPNVMVIDGQRAEICTRQEIAKIKGFKEPEKAGDKPVPEYDWTWAGLKLDVRPRLTQDEERASLETGVELQSLVGLEEMKYKGHKYETPIMEKTEIRTDMVVPLGKTMLIYGRNVKGLGGIVLKEKKDEPAKSLLVLIKATKAEE